MKNVVKKGESTRTSIIDLSNIENNESVRTNKNLSFVSCECAENKNFSHGETFLHNAKNKKTKVKKKGINTAISNPENQRNLPSTEILNIKNEIIQSNPNTIKYKNKRKRSPNLEGLKQSKKIKLASNNINNLIEKNKKRQSGRKRVYIPDETKPTTAITKRRRKMYNYNTMENKWITL